MFVLFFNLQFLPICLAAQQRFCFRPLRLQGLGIFFQHAPEIGVLAGKQS
jgi:hypothetical protein